MKGNEGGIAGRLTSSASLVVMVVHAQGGDGALHDCTARSSHIPTLIHDAIWLILQVSIQLSSHVLIATLPDMPSWKLDSPQSANAGA